MARTKTSKGKKPVGVARPASALSVKPKRPKPRPKKTLDQLLAVKGRVDAEEKQKDTIARSEAQGIKYDNPYQNVLDVPDYGSIGAYFHRANQAPVQQRLDDRGYTADRVDGEFILNPKKIKNQDEGWSAQPTRTNVYDQSRRKEILSSLSRDKMGGIQKNDENTRYLGANPLGNMGLEKFIAFPPQINPRSVSDATYYQQVTMEGLGLPSGINPERNEPGYVQMNSAPMEPKPQNMDTMLDGFNVRKSEYVKRKTANAAIKVKQDQFREYNMGEGNLNSFAPGTFSPERLFGQEDPPSVPSGEGSYPQMESSGYEFAQGGIDTSDADTIAGDVVGAGVGQFDDRKSIAQVQNEINAASLNEAVLNRDRDDIASFALQPYDSGDEPEPEIDWENTAYQWSSDVKVEEKRRKVGQKEEERQESQVAGYKDDIKPVKRRGEEKRQTENLKRLKDNQDGGPGEPVMMYPRSDGRGYTNNSLFANAGAQLEQVGTRGGGALESRDKYSKAMGWQEGKEDYGQKLKERESGANEPRTFLPAGPGAVKYRGQLGPGSKQVSKVPMSQEVLNSHTYKNTQEQVGAKGGGTGRDHMPTWKATQTFGRENVRKNRSLNDLRSEGNDPIKTDEVLPPTPPDSDEDDVISDDEEVEGGDYPDEDIGEDIPDQADTLADEHAANIASAMGDFGPQMARFEAEMALFQEGQPVMDDNVQSAMMSFSNKEIKEGKYMNYLSELPDWNDYRPFSRGGIDHDPARTQKRTLDVTPYMGSGDKQVSKGQPDYGALPGYKKKKKEVERTDFGSADPNFHAGSGTRKAPIKDDRERQETSKNLVPVGSGISATTTFAEAGPRQSVKESEVRGTSGLTSVPTPSQIPAKGELTPGNLLAQKYKGPDPKGKDFLPGSWQGITPGYTHKKGDRDVGYYKNK